MKDVPLRLTTVTATTWRFVWLEDFYIFQRFDGLSFIFEQGCYDALINYLDFNKNIVIGVSAGLILFQLFAAFLAFCLCKLIVVYRASSRL